MKMIEDFPVTLSGNEKYPWNDRLFKVDSRSNPLEHRRAKIFHAFVMKGMFLCKRARQDIHPVVTFLSARTTKPTEQDWLKLIRMMNFPKRTPHDILRLEMDDSNFIAWLIDAAFAVHYDMSSHTGALMSLGEGSIMSGSTKQKVNTRSSTEAELVGLDDYSSKNYGVDYF